jgi:hypothetical protein
MQKNLPDRPFHPTAASLKWLSMDRDLDGKSMKKPAGSGGFGVTMSEHST